MWLEISRKQAQSAQDEYMAASREYVASMNKIYAMRTAVNECQSGQTITGSIFGSCNDVIAQYNVLAERTNGLESQKDTLKSMAQITQNSYLGAVARA